MFALPACNRPFTQFPLFSSWEGLDWLTWVLLGVLLLSALWGWRWLIRVQRRRKWGRRRMMALASCTVVLLAILIFAEKGLTLFLPADRGTVVDAIVVLGRGTELGIPRIAVTAELWQAKRSPLVFVSGAGDTPRMLPLLAAREIPQSALDGESCSQTTPENALFSAAILQAQDIQSILLVTDGPHLWRSALDFQSQGFTVTPHASPLPASLKLVDKSFLIFREYLFLISSGLYQLLTGQRIPNANQPELMQLVQAAKQYGQQKQRAQNPVPGVRN